jgi:DNA-binding transcriptional regulator YdaS (Cro superfamily)
MPREERLCRRAELEFGQALPASLGAPVIERAVASLALADQEVAPTIDWNEAMRRQQAVDDQRLRP